MTYNSDNIPWQAAITGTKLAELKVALTASDGNIKQAAILLGISRQQVTRLVKAHVLNEFAAKLRLRAGGGKRVRDGERKGQVLGRPKK